MRLATIWVVLTYGAMTPVLGVAAEAPRCADGTDASAAASAARRSAGDTNFILVEDGGSIRPVFYERVGDLAVMEGDLVLGSVVDLDRQAALGPLRLNSADTDSSEFTAQGLASKLVLNGKRRWTKGVVPFTIAPGLPQADLVRQAMDAWSKVTPVSFVERNDANASSYKNYVTFQAGTNQNACLADYLGMKGGQQFVRLVTGCEYGQVLHEIGHVLGLDHEQNRSDRNRFVKVNINNIFNVDVSQFMQRPDLEADLNEYDSDSIMHYGTNDFSCNGKPTIEPLVQLPAGVQLGQRSHLSDGDIAAVRRLYK